MHFAFVWSITRSDIMFVHLPLHVQAGFLRLRSLSSGSIARTKYAMNALEAMFRTAHLLRLLGFTSNFDKSLRSFPEKAIN
jgi:hypothetical protein